LVCAVTETGHPDKHGLAATPCLVATLCSVQRPWQHPDMQQQPALQCFS